MLYTRLFLFFFDLPSLPLPPPTSSSSSYSKRSRKVKTCTFAEASRSRRGWQTAHGRSLLRSLRKTDARRRVGRWAGGPVGRSTVLHTLNPAADFPRAAFGFYAGALTRVPCHGGRGEAGAGEAGSPGEASERAAERGANVGGRGKKQKMKTRERRRKRERKRKKPREREKNTKRERE